VANVMKKSQTTTKSFRNIHTFFFNVTSFAAKAQEVKEIKNKLPATH
jgi:hypothetical protein